MQKASIYFLSLLVVSGTVQPSWLDLGGYLPTRSSAKAEESEQNRSEEKGASGEEQSTETTAPSEPQTVVVDKEQFVKLESKVQNDLDSLKTEVRNDILTAEAKIEGTIQEALEAAVQKGQAEYKSHLAQLIKESKTNKDLMQRVEARRIEAEMLESSRKAYFDQINAVETELSALSKNSTEKYRAMLENKTLDDFREWEHAYKEWFTTTKRRLGVLGVVGLKGTADYYQHSPDVPLYRVISESDRNREQEEILRSQQ